MYSCLQNKLAVTNTKNHDILHQICHNRSTKPNEYCAICNKKKKKDKFQKLFTNVLSFVIVLMEKKCKKQILNFEDHTIMKLDIIKMLLCNCCFLLLPLA